MKIHLEENRIRASLEDEGRDVVFDVAVVLRYAEGQILPVLVFGKTPAGSEQLVASVQRRIVRLLGGVHVAPSGKRAFPLSAGESVDPRTNVAAAKPMERLGVSNNRMKSLPRLPRL